MKQKEFFEGIRQQEKELLKEFDGSKPVNEIELFLFTEQIIGSDGELTKQALDDIMSRSQEQYKYGKELLNPVIISSCPEEKLRPALRKSMARKLVKNKAERKRQLILSLVCFLAGVLLLALGSIFNPERIAVLYEIVLVISWVFVWTAVEMFFFERQKSQFKKYRIIALADAEIKVKTKN